ncbi:MAG: hypothetical protein EPO37_00490 [Nitrosarchaeum sp.]|nr:MAG: hypothetical protein EPO37_00490 [Nitrosarchaeum sp.]
MADIVNTALNLVGLGLQIEGVLIIAYAVRKIAFKKKGMFDSNILDSEIFDTSTTSDNAPIDEETNKKTEEITTIDPRKTKFGVISIVTGLAFQFLAIIISH